MATGGIITDVGKNLMLRRLYLSDQTATTQFKVGTGTNTPATTDTDLQTPVLTKVFVAGYPIFDITNKKVTVRGFISSTEANGSSLTETGEFNTDTPFKMISRDVYPLISKTSSDELAYLWTHKIID